jgi:hypothetical protein
LLINGLDDRRKRLRHYEYQAYGRPFFLRQAKACKLRNRTSNDNRGNRLDPCKSTPNAKCRGAEEAWADAADVYAVVDDAAANDVEAAWADDVPHDRNLFVVRDLERPQRK